MAIKQPSDENPYRIDIQNQLAEDPYREPHEKESVFSLSGDGTHLEVTSFKKVIYGKIIKRPEFEPTWFNAIDSTDRETTVDSYEEVLERPDLRVIGVVGRIPVGAFSIGVPRNSNSQAKVVK